MIGSLIKEIKLRKDELQNEIVETIYFGGGTPSVLTTDEIKLLIEAIYTSFEVVENPEITLEANPDDLSEEKIIALSKSPINRLSIGIQSFFERDLRLMNRAHNAKMAPAQYTIKQSFKRRGQAQFFGLHVAYCGKPNFSDGYGVSSVGVTFVRYSGG